MNIWLEIVVWIARGCLIGSFVFLFFYALRHHRAAWNRFRHAPAKDAMELVGFVEPRLTVMIPMHNEERVAADILQALVDSDYDWDRLEIIPINDRSSDGTARIVDQFAARYPKLIKPLHRAAYDGLETNGGKPGALQYAMEKATGDVLMLFDADYVPGRSLLKMLAAPFHDPETGAVMGRVVPHNAGDSLLAGLLSLERAAGYQVSQMTHFNRGLTAQFGGTVGGVRMAALKAVGGWNTHSLTEDTDLTCRLLLRGWKVAYVNRAECYEEVPEKWPVRKRQLMRWVMGHTECFHNYVGPILRARHLSRRQRVDALMTLGCYFTAPVLVSGWLSSVILFLAQRHWMDPLLLIMLTWIGFQGFANQATFAELGVAGLLDGTRHRILLLPLSLMNFFASTIATCEALLKFYWRRITGGGNGEWEKTRRFRPLGASGPKPTTFFTRGRTA